ncbi:MAG: TetR/AcrR family transcriptional regulator [Pseudomonadota bacterium]
MPHDPEKERRVLEAALPLFVKQGLRHTTVEQIAASAGIGKGTVYLYFESKGGILLAIARREAGELLRKVRSAVRREHDATGQLRAFLQARVQGVRDLLSVHGIAADLMRELRPDIESLYQEFNLAERAIVEDILEGGVERGEWRVDDVAMASLAISASLRALEEPWLYEGRELRQAQKVDALHALFIQGLRNLSSPARPRGVRS